MDSLTQITLGAAVGEAVAGRQAGRTAPLWGAALGTLPDLDVLANPFLTESQALIFHRSASHSLLVAALLTPLLAWGLRRIHGPETSGRRWAALVGAVLFTHIGLDCLTSYGTQIFWPLSREPVIGSTIFIIDPLYTVPLAAGLLTALWWAPSARTRRGANYIGLAFSSAYLLLTIVNKVHVNQVFTDALAAQDLPTKQVFTKPTPFNNLLWSGIARGEDGYYVGYYSLLDDDQSVDFRYVPRRHDLLGGVASAPEVQRVLWFSQGFYVVRRSADGDREIAVLRFGRNDLGLTDAGKYIFTFQLVENSEGAVTRIRQVRPDVSLDADLLRRFAARIRGHERGSDVVRGPARFLHGYTNVFRLPR